MNNLLKILNLSSWSIRRKLVVAIAIAIVSPMLLLFIVLEVGANARDLRTTEAYVELVGEERTKRVSSAIREATSTLRDVSNNLRYQRDLLRVFQPDVSRTERQNTVDNLNDRLIQTRLFVDVRLVNPDGSVVANTLTPRSPSQMGGMDMSSSLSFLAGEDAVLLGEDQRSVIYQENNATVMDVVQVIYYSDRTLAGYLIATLNLERIVSTYLNPVSDFISLVSYLTTSEGLLLSQTDDRPFAEGSLSRANRLGMLSGTANIHTYAIGDEQYTNYIAPIAETRFLLITETPEEIPLTSPIDAFFDGNGILALIVIVFIGVGLVVVLNTLFSTPLNTLREVVNNISAGHYDTRITTTQRRDEIGALGQSLDNLREQVRQTVGDLETRVADRVRDIQATQQVSRAASTERDLQKLMDAVVNLIVNVFPNIYHAQIFLIDSEAQYAVLRASTGSAGQKLLTRGHRLAVGSVSVIGQVTSEGRTMIARDTSASSVHKRNEFLPDTQAELAIPLRVGDLIIGALDVQSKQGNSFTEDQVNVLQIMADQIAISLDNARLYQESIQRLNQLTEGNRQQTLSSWQQHMYRQRTTAVVTEVGIKTGIDRSSLREEVLQNGETIIGEKTERNTIPFAVPIQLRGQTLGAVEWEVPAVDYSYEKVLLAEELVSRLAISLDNARLFEQSQRATERERVVNSIAARLTGQTDIDEILQTAIREVGLALRVPEVNIRLHVGRENGNGHKAN
jgi:GAF domain-containing protein/HAMP domain-containing protein